MLVLADLFGKHSTKPHRKEMIVQITFTPAPTRPTLIFDSKKFEEVTIKPEDVNIEAQTYMLTPVGRRLVQLIVELTPFNTLGSITIRAIEMRVTVDTGMDVGQMLELEQYALLASTITHLDNLTPEAFSVIDSGEIRNLVEGQLAKATTATDADWL